MSKFSPEDINAAAASLEARGKVIVGQETGVPPEWDFSFLTKA